MKLLIKTKVVSTLPHLVDQRAQNLRQNDGTFWFRGRPIEVFLLLLGKIVVEKKLTELPAVTTLVTEDKGGHRFIS